jgi:two-component system phosphate regulon sensor histidine kinase PhoR
LRAHASDLKASKSRVFVIHDVTKERQLDDMRRDFIANVSHELRTPVSVIRANSETLLDGALPATEVLATKFVQATLRNAERLSSLIADLLDLASIEGGGYKLEPRELLVEPACQRVAEALAESASARNIRIEVNVADEVQVYADSRALDQVITNLLANAIKYTHEGTLIYIGAELVARGVRIHVDDQGPGIPDEHRPRVFERFYRVDVSRSRALGGTGLGLAIAKHLTSAMGGKIGVEPVEPNGCSFWFILPPRQPVGERFSYAPEA